MNEPVVLSTVLLVEGGKEKGEEEVKIPLKWEILDVINSLFASVLVIMGFALSVDSSKEKNESEKDDFTQILSIIFS